MKNILLRLMKVIVIPALIVGYSVLMTLPLILIFTLLGPANVVSYVLFDKFWFPAWLSKWPEPICILLDKVNDIGVKK